VIVGTLLFGVAMVAVSGKYMPKAALPDIAMASIAPGYGGYRGTVDPVILPPDSTSF
jgi:hypothetical protein